MQEKQPLPMLQEEIQRQRRLMNARAAQKHAKRGQIQIKFQKGADVKKT